MPPSISSGARANRTGRRLESFTADLLDELGYEEVHPQLFYAARAMMQPIFARQVEVGRDLYGKMHRADFMLYHPQRWKDCLVIECKWQARKGSVEEKYPFLVLSINQNQFDTIILLDGGGYTDGAKSWMRQQAGKDRLKHVFDQGDLQRYASKGLL